MGTLKQQSSFVKGNPTSAQQLESIIFGCGWLGCKWIANWKSWPIFSSCLFILEKSPKTDYSWFVREEIISHFPPLRAISSLRSGSLLNIWAVLINTPQNVRDTAPSFTFSLYNGTSKDNGR